ncbi:ribonuclease kappa [Drosophila montana]|uniref:ribonuclease kappa n=1 Tax=Drosophila montana TaxID=40370 RepID=UPI00313F2EFC
MPCVCGKKCSLLCLFISIWAIFQLLLMGMSYSMHSLAFLKSLPLKDHYNSLKEFRTEADRAFGELAIRCYVTAVLYACFAFISYICFCLRNRRLAATRNPNQHHKRKA